MQWPVKSQLLRKQRSGGLWLEARLGKKLLRSHLNKQAWPGAHNCDPSYAKGVVERLKSKSVPVKNTRPYLKNN
jgi:hypothetical protein